MVKMIIVGSTAAKYFWKDWREPSDLDLWHREDSIYMKGDGEDVHILPVGVMNLIPDIDGYATPDALYTIKLSHLGWDNHAWEKHKTDALVMQQRGCKLITPLYDALVEHWKKELGDKDFLSLSQNKEDFFTDNVEYTYDHDHLHSLVSYPDLPIYSLVLKEGEDVLVDREKFNQLPFEQRVRMFREEMTVIAMERWVIPSRGKVSWLRAWQWSVRKTITSLTKGWATSFIVLNLEYFIKPDYSYFKNIVEELNMSSKADLTIFEKLAEESGESLESVIYQLASNECYDLDQPENYKWLQGDTGGEGEGEYCYGVFQLNGKTYKAEWSYYSYHGCEYDYITETLKEVEPVEKLVTVYE